MTLVKRSRSWRPHVPITALSRSCGCFLFGSLSWPSTASRAAGSGPFRMKNSRNLGNRRTTQRVGHQERRPRRKGGSPSSRQGLRHTRVIVLGDTHRVFHLFQHFRLPGVKGHDGSEFGDSVHLTVVLTP